MKIKRTPIEELIPFSPIIGRIDTPKNTTKFIIWKTILRFNAFLPIENSEEIMSANENTMIQAIKRSMPKYALSDNHISKVIAPLSALPTVAIIDLIRVINEMLVISNVSVLTS